MALRAAIVLSMLSASPLFAAAEAPVELTWAKLMPPSAQPQPSKSKSFLSGATPAQQGSEPPPPTPLDPEAGWMSQRRLQPGTGGQPAVVVELDGKRVHIGGYVVPLDFDSTTVKEFLLVPYVGACVHVPPPPPNQVIYVKSEHGVQLGGVFDPVYVTGTLKAAGQFTGLAETGYTIEAEKVDAKKE